MLLTETLPHVFHPIRRLGNSKERFSTISAYKPPSAPKLMSSKKMPYIVDCTGAPGLVVMSNWRCAPAGDASRAESATDDRIRFSFIFCFSL